MVLHRPVGVREGHVNIGTIARHLAHIHEEFQIHHIVDDDRILPNIFVEVPRTN